MAEDKVLINYKKQITYNNTPENQVGAGTDTGLRTIPTPSGQVHYVRKFGTQYLITDVTDIEDPVDANMTFTVKALDGTTLGSRTGGGAFVDGSTVTAQGCYLEISASGGDVTVLASITIDTDIDAGGLAFTCAAETIYDGNTLILYLSDTGSTYYDSDMKLGGARHTPVVNNSRKPFFHPYDAYADAAMGANDGVEIVDSETYAFPYKDSGGTWRYEMDLDHANTYLYSTDGQEPKIKSIIGTDIEREVSGLFNNANAIFFNENGTNVDTGATGYEDTWHDPYATIANAITAASGKGVTLIIYGGTGASEGDFAAANLGAGYTLEPEYGYIPTINDGFAIQHASANISGFIIVNIRFDVVWTGRLSNNNFNNPGGVTISQLAPTADDIDGNINNNIFSGGTQGISMQEGNGDIHKNIFYNYTSYGVFIEGLTTDMDVYDNIFYNNDTGLHLKADVQNVNGTIENNTFFNNVNGLSCVGGNLLSTVRNIISYSNTTWDLLKTGGAATITYTHYGTNSGWTIGAGNEQEDPIFCDTSNLPYKLGISGTVAYRLDNNNDDKGTHLRIVQINESDIEINGIIFDGNEQYNNAVYIADNTDHTGTIIKWCSMYDFQGIPIDLYDASADLDAIVSNNLIYECGNGLKLAYGGNTVEENVFYNNSIIAIWADYTGTTFNHNIFFRNQYGLYLESNTDDLTITNNIFDQNTLYDIYSEILVTITYCCFTGAMNNVTTNDASNVTDAPLFINITAGTEDFNIKTIEAGYTVNSGCKDASDTTAFPDIGAYDLDRSINDEYWQKYQLSTNPENLNMGIISKSLRNIEEGLGSKILFAKSHKRVLPFAWLPSSRMDEAQRKTLEYMSTLIPTRENNLLKTECTFRISLQPTNYLYTGTGTISALTITDVTKTWIENELKAWWAGVQYETGTATGTITGKVLQVAPSPAWTNDEWIGYYFHYNGYYYYITDNDADELTLSDPDDTLSNAANIDWNIEKYFRIASNTDTIITVEDDNSELVAGSYEYYIDFIECRLQNSKINYTQLPRFKWTREFSKSGQSIVFEES